MKKIERSFNSTLRNTGKGLRKVKLRQVSLSKAKTLKLEAKLSHAMKEKCGFKCQFCGADYSHLTGNLGKHEIVSRGAGGDPLDPENTIILCWINFTSNPFTLGCHQLAQQGLITKEQLLKIKAAENE